MSELLSDPEDVVYIRVQCSSQALELVIAECLPNIQVWFRFTEHGEPVAEVSKQLVCRGYALTSTYDS